MSIFQAVVLGLVQGITEFLPISSSGFLVLIPELLGWEVQSVAFDAFVHLATLAAVIAALWPEVSRILLAYRPKTTDKEVLQYRKLAQWIVLATIPVVLAGLIGGDFLENHIRSAEIVAWSFIVWGIVLYMVDKRASNKGQSVERVGLNRALGIGLAQVLALIPGTSRSGITITAGLIGGLSRETAARFSFLLAIPTIAAAGFWKLGEVVSSPEVIGVLPLAIGFITAGLSAYLVVKLFLKFLQRFTYSEIAVFRVVMGVVILLLI